jgi:hypothetical protein
LATVETKYEAIINRNTMVEEDNRSQAYLNFHKWIVIKLAYEELLEQDKDKAQTIEELHKKVEALDKQKLDGQMIIEDHVC